MKRIIDLLFKIVIVVEILWGAYAWFTWSWYVSAMSQLMIYLVALIISFLYKRINRIHLIKNKWMITAIVVYVLANTFAYHFAPSPVAMSILNVYPMWVLLSDTKNAKSIFSFVTNTLAVLLFLGLCEFILLNIYRVPSIIIQYGDRESYTFFNYGLCIFKATEVLGDERLRFSSVFLEPGYLAVFTNFLLFGTKYNFKNRANRIILYSIICSFSLAGYVLLFIGYMFHKYIQGFSLQKYVGLFAVTIVLFLFFSNYNDGKNIVNELIIERIMPDDEHMVSGDNRSSERTKEYFLQSLGNGDFVLGMGIERINKINGKDFGGGDAIEGDDVFGTGIVYYILVSGVVSMFLFFIFYYMIAAHICDNIKFARLFVLLVFITFIQASYPYSPSWLFPYILVVVLNRKTSVVL